MLSNLRTKHDEFLEMYMEMDMYTHHDAQKESSSYIILSRSICWTTYCVATYSIQVYHKSNATFRNYHPRLKRICIHPINISQTPAECVVL